MADTQHQAAVRAAVTATAQLLRVTPVGLAAYQRLADLGILVINQDGSYSPGAVDSGTFAGDLDHLTLTAIVNAANTAATLAGPILPAQSEARAALSAVVR